MVALQKSMKMRCLIFNCTEVAEVRRSKLLGVLPIYLNCKGDGKEDVRRGCFISGDVVANNHVLSERVENLCLKKALTPHFVGIVSLVSFLQAVFGGPHQNISTSAFA